MNYIKFLIVIIIIFATGCVEKESNTISDEKVISITDTWIRPGNKDRNTAAFMNIVNNTEFEDTLFTANSNLAEVVEIHETYTRENDLKGMRQVEYVVVPKNSVRELKPNGLHIMLIGLERNLAIGDSGEITLDFKSAGKVTLKAEVR